MKQEALNYINNSILRQSQKLAYRVSSHAPETFQDLKNSGLVIWSGASNKTIFEDASVNWGLRALHDAEHLKTGLLFIPEQEIELGRIQASRQSSELMADLIYCEISLQSEYFLKNGTFVENQKEFMLNNLKKIYKINTI